MNLQSRKLQAIGFLVNCQDEELFSKIEETISDSQQQELKMKPSTQKQMVERAKHANEDYLAGRFKTQEQLEFESKTWDSKKVDFWDNLPQSQKDEILKGIEEIENDETVNYEQFIKNHR